MTCTMMLRGKGRRPKKMRGRGKIILKTDDDGNDDVDNDDDDINNDNKSGTVGQY